MKPKQAFTLLLAVAAVIALIVAYNRIYKPRQAEKRDKSMKLLPALGEARIDKITIGLPDGEATLVLAGGSTEWVVENLDRYPADSYDINRAIRSLDDLTKDMPISQNPDNHSRLGVDEAGIKVSMYAQDKVVAELIVGKQGESRGSFVRLPGENTVYSVSENLVSIFDKPAGEFRTGRVFDFDLGDLETIELTMLREPELLMPEIDDGDTAGPADGGTAAEMPDLEQGNTGDTAGPADGGTAAETPDLEQGNTEDAAGPADGGTLEAMDGATAEAARNFPRSVVIKSGDRGYALVVDGASVESDQARAESAARGLANLQVSEFADEVTIEEAGLDEPSARFEFFLADGGTVVLLIGDRRDAAYFVKRSDRDAVLLVSQYSLDNALDPERLLGDGDEEPEFDPSSLLPVPDLEGGRQEIKEIGE